MHTCIRTHLAQWRAGAENHCLQIEKERLTPFIFSVTSFRCPNTVKTTLSAQAFPVCGQRMSLPTFCFGRQAFERFVQQSVSPIRARVCRQLCVRAPRRVRGETQQSSLKVRIRLTHWLRELRAQEQQGPGPESAIPVPLTSTTGATQCLQQPVLQTAL